jgi:hypothetical protein
MQNGRQILTSLIAEQIARHEHLTIKQQIANSQEVNQFLQDKFTNEELYLWMQGEVSRLFYQYYRFAFDTARKAELAMKRDLMRPEVDAQTFVQFNYWDGGRKGLLCGEALHFDVKRMELAYHDNNKRELELTRHISVRQLNPLALLSLKTSNTCTVDVPEWLYDRDCPGHYLRRIKSVAVSIPSVVGPYTSLNCTLTLLGSSIRKSALLADGEYARQGFEDIRFVDYPGGGQSMVTSTGNNDPGMFEPAQRGDERYFWFEGAGAISTWKLELPMSYRAFDYSTIADVILHIRYTARQGIDKVKVGQALDDVFAAVPGATFGLLFSLTHDFPVEWSTFVNSAADFSAVISRDYFPYFTQEKAVTITSFEIYGKDLMHHAFGDANAATTDLADKTKLSFTISVKPDTAGPTQALIRDTEGEAFVIVRYTL